MKGLNRVQSRLRALPDQARASALRAAREAAEETVKSARAAVPVRTGALKSSIAAEPLSNGAKASANRPYAGYVENGFRRVPAHPYLLPAARRSDFLRRAARALREALK